ncbi:PadR family transcriptional regulator [Mycobacterium sp.]|uniref:PadR family transcriptional regulator n=1 Tax=Mycobacterium sp. TaxID=1785 RepID=UPI00127E43B6|nr:MAG: helix-turn-helix transcriptional regulator [Mycobacterium sp.]
MNTPCAPSEKPFADGGPGSLCLGPEERLREQRRQARRESHDHLCGHDAGRGGFRPGFGRGCGPGGSGFDVGPRRARRRGGAGRYGRRGDVRATILALLAERPMRGHEMIQEIARRSQDLWRPGPGSVYPTLQLLVDEELIESSETGSAKRLFELTEAGRDAAKKVTTPPRE